MNRMNHLGDSSLLVTNIIFVHPYLHLGFPGGSVVKNLLANAGDEGDAGWIPGWRRSAREGDGNPLQYSCLENPMERGAWGATVHGVTKESDMT